VTNGINPLRSAAVINCACEFMSMRSKTIIPVDLARTETWTKYQKNLCGDCGAGCCRLPVEVRTEDLVRMELLDSFEAEEPPKQLAKKLQKAGIIDHFNYKHAVFTLAQRANDDCLFLDRQSRRCTIYDKRPRTCRNHPQVGPRPGYCAYQQKDKESPGRTGATP